MEFMSITTKGTIIHKMKCHSTMSMVDGNIYRLWETRFTLPATDGYRMSTETGRLQPWYRSWKTGCTGLSSACIWRIASTLKWKGIDVNLLFSYKLEDTF